MANYDIKAPRPSNQSPIEKARLAKGLTQTQLAEAIGVNNRQISVWECSSVTPSVTTLAKIADALGVNINDLITEHKKKEPNNNIAQIRKEKGLTQTQLASAIGTSQTMIQKYECGVCKASKDTLKKLASALEVDVSRLEKEPVGGNQFGATIAEYRKAQNMTQKQLANATGISTSTIANYEANRTSPSDENLAKVASALNIPVEALVQKGAHEEVSDSDSDA